MPQTTRAADGADLNPQPAQDEPFLQPWQFFLLGGMLAATATVIVATGQSPANIIILSLTVVSVSFVGLGAYRILLPLVSPAVDVPSTIGGRTRAAMEREKTLVLRSIKELEFDYAMGKVARADFDEMSGRLRARAMGIMKLLDAGGGYREQIAREIEQRLGRLEGDGLSHRQEPATAEAVALQTNLCSSCETENDVDARFCKNCGAKL
jgi:ribosomal protein L40E